MDIVGNQRVKSTYVFSFIAVLVLLPWSFKLSGIVILVMTVTGLMSNPWKEKQQRLKENLQALIFLVFYALYWIGMSYTHYSSEGLKSLEQKSFLLLPLVVSSSVKLTGNQIKNGA